jgi:hypothetical protein
MLPRWLKREIVFLLWRAAGKIDTEHTLIIAKTIARIAAAREQQDHLTVDVKVARAFAERLHDWSEPVQIMFAPQVEAGEVGTALLVRSVEQVVITETIRARAERQ